MSGTGGGGGRYRRAGARWGVANWIYGSISGPGETVFSFFYIKSISLTYFFFFPRVQFLSVFSRIYRGLPIPCFLFFVDGVSLRSIFFILLSFEYHCFSLQASRINNKYNIMGP
jgi:hypothetical protein